MHVCTPMTIVLLISNLFIGLRAGTLTFPFFVSLPYKPTHLHGRNMQVDCPHVFKVNSVTDAILCQRSICGTMLLLARPLVIC